MGYINQQKSKMTTNLVNGKTNAALKLQQNTPIGNVSPVRQFQQINLQEEIGRQKCKDKIGRQICEDKKGRLIVRTNQKNRNVTTNEIVRIKTEDRNVRRNKEDKNCKDKIEG